MWARAAVIVVLPALAFAIWQAARPPTGWPAVATPPKTAGFLWAYVREPDALTHNRGEIVLWLAPPNSDEPRAYRMPYTRQLHKQALAAMRATKGSGVKVGFKRTTRHSERGPQTVYRLYRLPPTRLETKAP